VGVAAYFVFARRFCHLACLAVFLFGLLMIAGLAALATEWGLHKH
jgi:hypothetical protein